MFGERICLDDCFNMLEKPKVMFELKTEMWDEVAWLRPIHSAI